MDETGIGTDDLGEVGQEGDDIMLHLALDGVDALDIKGGVLALGPDGLGRFLRMTPRSARASQAWASISNQILKRVCGSQMVVISGRE